MGKNWNGYETGNLLITNRKWDSHMCEFVIGIGTCTLLLLAWFSGCVRMVNGATQIAQLLYETCAFVTFVNIALNTHTSIYNTYTILQTHVFDFRLTYGLVCASVREFVPTSVWMCLLGCCVYWCCSFNQTVNSTDGVDLNLHWKTYTCSFARVLQRGGYLSLVFHFIRFFFYIRHLVHNNRFIRNSNSIVSMPFFSFISNAIFIVRCWVLFAFVNVLASPMSWDNTRIQ